MDNENCLRSGCQYANCQNCEDYACNYTEDLAELSHEQWSGWAKRLLSKCCENKDGSVTISKQDVDRLKWLMTTPYEDLPSEEQEKDRQAARRAMDLADIWYFSDEEKGIETKNEKED